MSVDLVTSSRLKFAAEGDTASTRVDAIYGVSIVDVVRAVVRPGMTIHVSDGRIRAVSEARSGEHGAQASRELVAIPGLIDCHVHLSHDGEANWSAREPRDHADETIGVIRNAQTALLAGITTVRDCGCGPARAPVALARSGSASLRTSEVIACGRPITITGGHLHSEGIEADGGESVRRAVRTESKFGAQWIKIIATGGVLTPGTDIGGASYSYDELEVGVIEARRAGRRVAAHAIGTAGIKNALRAGATTIEHGTFLDDEAVELMHEKEAFHVPTLSAYHRVVTVGPDGGVPKDAVEKAKGAQAAHLHSFVRSLGAGISIAAGTDAGTPFNYHGGLAFELELMTRAGASPQMALRSATSQAAAALGRSDDIGRVEAGMRADLVLLESNPLEDITCLARPDAVMKDGHVIASPFVMHVLRQASDLER